MNDNQVLEMMLEWAEAKQELTDVEAFNIMLGGTNEEDVQQTLHGEGASLPNNGRDTPS